MTLKRDILANYLGAGVAVLAPVVALPWYLAALGPDQFGLIGFIVMLQAVLGLIDAGMSQALVREITVRLDSPGRKRHGAAALLFGFERIYWLFGLGSGFVMVLLADLIATRWLNLKDMPIEVGKEAIYGAAALFAMQFPGSIYRSVLVGAQAQVILNGIVLSGALLRHIGGVIVVFIWPTLLAYLLWHGSVAFLETTLRGRYAWRALDIKRNQVGWEFSEVRAVWKIVAGLSGAAWLGALTVQMDKIFLSRSSTIDQFGYYMIAATVATGILQLVYPLIQAVLPRAVKLRAQPAALRALSVKLACLISLIAAIGAVAFVSAGKLMLNLWLRNSEAVQGIYQILAILLVGTSLNALYNVGYLNWLVYEKTHRVFQVNTLALVLSLAVIPPLVDLGGPVGAAFGWVTINLIGFLLSLEWIKKKSNERNNK